MPGGTHPRLRALRLRGFKTFAKPTELRFEPGVTVIIGPNGSGKSNIADAVLWVLGEQSPGNLRGRNMHDVIFSGPDGRRSSVAAEVSLSFDNGGTTHLPTGFEEVEVTRRLARDSSSEYLVNGSGCRLLDVLDVVGSMGLGREMHSVISQGKVEALLNSGPEARRALVEEAAGLGRFKKRRERAQSKLARAKQNLLRVGDVEREVKANLRPLRQQVAAVERHAEALEEWAAARAKVLLLTLSEAEAVLAETEDRLSRLSTRRLEIDARLARLRRERSAQEEQFTGMFQEREDISAAYQQAEAHRDRLETRAGDLGQRAARLEADYERTIRRQELSESRARALLARVEDLSEAGSDRQRLRRLEAILTRLRDSLGEISPAYQAAIAGEEDLKDSVFELEAARSRAVQDRDFLRRELTEKQRIDSELASLAGQLAQGIERYRTEAGELEAKRGILTEEQARLTAELAFAVEEYEIVRSRVVDANHEEARIRERLAGLEAREQVLRDILRRLDGVPTGGRALLAQVEGSRLLTETLSVRSGYERAFAAALGPLIQAVVVPAGSSLKRAVTTDEPFETLRQVAPGFSVAAVEDDRRQPPFGTDLWDFVTGPPAVISALRALLPPTVVVDEIPGDLLQSSEDKGWCVVSRAGVRVEGGLHVARRRELGAEALLKAGNELELLVGQREAVQAERVRAHAEIEVAGASLSLVQPRVRQVEMDLRAVERDLALTENQIELVLRRTDEAVAEHGELQKRREKEQVLAGELTAGLESLESAMAQRDLELGCARTALRQRQAVAETLRNDVRRLEEKKTQASLIDVRLRERCRRYDAEQERLRLERETLIAEAGRLARRAGDLGLYMPQVLQLMNVVQGLAERARWTLRALGKKLEDARLRSEGAAASLRDWGGEEADLQSEHDSLAAEAGELQVGHARAVDQSSRLQNELLELRRRHLSPRKISSEDVLGADLASLAAVEERAVRKRERVGPVNPLAEQECAEMEERARFLSDQRKDLEESMRELQEVVGELDEHIQSAFTELFTAASQNFGGVIETVFPGAKGALRLVEEEPQEVDSDGKTAPGVTIEVKFPNKAPRSMSLLSGGEKAMTAIAFLFSLFLARPCPFYILDEVEAALDDHNIRRFLSLIREYRDRTQFIIITHQRQTMEVADTLYGVVLESDGTSRVLSRRLGGLRRSGGEEQFAPDSATEKGA